MTDRKTIIFIVADERFHAGECDYIHVIAPQLKHAVDTDYFIYKVEATDPFQSDPTVFPIDKNAYRHVPGISSHTFNVIDQAHSLEINGLGNSTLAILTNLVAYATDHRISVNASYTTHMINNIEDAQLLAAQKIVVHAELSPQEFAEQFGTELAAKIGLREIQSVPNTYTVENFQIEWQKFAQLPQGKIILELVQKGQKIAVVILNAGFKIDDVHVPYTIEEAKIHGQILGQKLPPDTNLMLCHGGPRNLQDRDLGHDNLSAFAAAYLQAQMRNGASPQIIAEPYAPHLSYNAVKAGFELLSKENCVAFIAPAEGYGILDRLLQPDIAQKTQDKLIAIFPFAAQDADSTGQRRYRNERYHKKGIIILK